MLRFPGFGWATISLDVAAPRVPRNHWRAALSTPQFWIDLQGQYDIAVIERDRGIEITRRVRPADAA